MQNKMSDFNVQRILTEKQEMFSQRYLTNFKFDPLVSQIYRQKKLRENRIENEHLMKLVMKFNNTYYPLQKKEYLINRNGLIDSDRMQKVENVVQIGQNGDNDINILTNDRSLSRCHFQIDYSKYFVNYFMMKTLKQIQFRMKKQNVTVHNSVLKRVFEFVKVRKEIELIGLDTVYGLFVKVEEQKIQLVKDMMFMASENVMLLVKDVYKTDIEIDYSFVEGRKNTLTNFELCSTKNQKKKMNYIELQVIKGRPDRSINDNTIINDLILNEKCVMNYFEPLKRCRYLVDNYFFIDIDTSFAIVFNQMIQQWQIMKQEKDEKEYGLWMNVNLCKHNEQRYQTSGIKINKSCRLKINTLEMELQI